MVRQKQAPEKKATVATIATDGKKVVKKVVKAPRTIIRGAIPAAKPAAVGKLISVPEETKKPRRVYAHRGMEGIRKATLRRLLQKGGSLRVAKPSYHRVRVLMHSFLHALIKNAHAYASYCGRKTITHTDMVDALSNMSRHFLGASAL